MCLLALQLSSFNLYGQSCCSGGVPLSGNIGMPINDESKWQVSLNYDLNVLKTIKDGTTKLDDNTRRRTTHSVLGQVGYTISEKFSVESFFSFIRQERKITPIGQPENFVSTDGIGDAVVLLKYRFIKNFQIGVGLKMPLGSSDLTNDSGITLNADLQPGSGAWDVVYWLGGSQNLKFRKSMNLIGSAIYRLTGRNNSYLGNQVYKFGNEVQINAGVADRFTIGTVVVDPSISFKYRHVRPDKNEADNIAGLKDVPSTGGEWVFIRPALAYNLSYNVSIQANIELPLYAKLVNTQVTPTYRINVGVNFILKNKELIKNTNN